jgi:hypothetical protein
MSFMLHLTVGGGRATWLLHAAGLGATSRTSTCKFDQPAARSGTLINKRGGAYWRRIAILNLQGETDKDHVAFHEQTVKVFQLLEHWNATTQKSVMRGRL